MCSCLLMVQTSSSYHFSQMHSHGPKVSQELAGGKAGVGAGRSLSVVLPVTIESLHIKPGLSFQKVRQWLPSLLSQQALESLHGCSQSMSQCLW